MNGTEKQIEWANKIRTEFFEKIAAVKNFIERGKSERNADSEKISFYGWAETDLTDTMATTATAQIAELESFWISEQKAPVWIDQRGELFGKFEGSSTDRNIELVQFIDELDSSLNGYNCRRAGKSLSTVSPIEFTEKF